MADEINLEADRVLRIWAESKRNERGTVTQGYPKRSAGIECGGSCGEETFDLMVAKSRASLWCEGLLIAKFYISFLIKSASLSLSWLSKSNMKSLSSVTWSSLD